jgi:hypothetical protein
VIFRNKLRNKPACAPPKRRLYIPKRLPYIFCVQAREPNVYTKLCFLDDVDFHGFYFANESFCFFAHFKNASAI